MLMLSPEAPWPATTGGLGRIGGLLNHLATHCDVTFIAPRRPDQRPPDDPRIRFICPEVPAERALRRALALLDPSRPLHVAFYTRRVVADLVRQELAERRYDVVYSHFLYHLGYLGFTRVPVVVDTQNVDRVYWQNKADNSPFRSISSPHGTRGRPSPTRLVTCAGSGDTSRFPRRTASRPASTPRRR